MAGALIDPDVRMLAAVSGTLQSEYAQSTDPWAGSPFAWIKSQSSRRRGKIGEQLIAGFLAAKGFDVARARDSQADLVINGRRIEVKFSTRWEQGSYTFQQIREQDYELAVFLGICPFDAHMWIITKALLREHMIGKLGQHSGAKGTETAWISFAPATPPTWLIPCGGRLRDAVKLLNGLAPRIK